MFEADQPMLSYLRRLYENLRFHFNEFKLKYGEELTLGEIPPPKNSRKESVRITLCESFDKDFEFIWRPAMSAAAMFDPLNWKLNALRAYHVPVRQLSEKELEELKLVIEGFVVVEDDDALGPATIARRRKEEAEQEVAAMTGL